MEDAYAYACSGSGVGYAMEIDEAGVAHDAMESVEGYEREDIDDETYAQAQGDLPEALCQLQSTMLEVVHNKPDT